MSILVRLTWDNEASVWIAESEDVPGLVLESGSLDALIERVKHAIPELLELNGRGASTFSLKTVCERVEQVAV